MLGEKRQEPEAKVFFGDRDITERFAAQCVEIEADTSRPHLARVIQTIFPIRFFGENAYAQIALQDGEGVALICALHAYHFTICQAGHIWWIDQHGENVHRRMLDGLDQTQLSAAGPGMDVRNIVNRSLRWYAKRGELEDDDYQERMAIQDARYLTIASHWLSFLNEQIGRAYFGA